MINKRAECLLSLMSEKYRQDEKYKVKIRLLELEKSHDRNRRVVNTSLETKIENLALEILASNEAVEKAVAEYESTHKEKRKHIPFWKR